MQHKDLRPQYQSHLKGAKRARALAEQAVPDRRGKRQRVGEESLREKLRYAHVREVIENGRCISIPVGVVDLVPLSNALRGDHTPVDKVGLGDRLFLKMVDMSAGRKKTLVLPAAAREAELCQSDMALTVHACMDVDASEDQPVVSLKSQSFGTPPSPAMVLAENVTGNRAQAWELDALLWRTKPTLLYSLQGIADVDAQTNRQVTAELLRANAAPGCDGALAVGVHDELMPALQSLLAAGAVEEVGTASTDGSRKFKLTGAAMRSLEYGEALESPVPLLSARPDIPIEDATAHECLQMLDAAGFTWRPLPARVAHRSALSYEVGGPKHWYSTRAQVPRRSAVVMIMRQTDGYAVSAGVFSHVSISVYKSHNFV